MLGAGRFGPDQGEDQRQQRETNKGEEQIAPAPAEGGEDQCHDRQERDMAGGRAGVGHADGKSPVVVEMARDGSRRDVLGDDAKTDAAEDGIGDHDLPRLRHLGRQAQRGSGHDEAAQKNAAGTEGIEQVTDQRTGERHTDEGIGDHGRNEAPRPAEVALQRRHGEADRRAGGGHHAEGEEHDQDDQPALGIGADIGKKAIFGKRLCLQRLGPSNGARPRLPGRRPVRPRIALSGTGAIPGDFARAGTLHRCRARMGSVNC